MLDEQVAGEHRGDLLLAIQRHVHREIDADHAGDLADVVVDRIALGDAPGRVRVADALGVVQHQHRLETREPGGHHLRAAAEAGEEVRLDEPGRDPDVGVHPRAIQVTPARRWTSCRRAPSDAAIAAVVVDDAIAARRCRRRASSPAPPACWCDGCRSRSGW